MNNAVFRQTMENVRKHRDIELVTTEKRRNYGITKKLSYYKIFTESLLAKEMKKTDILMDRHVYLGLSILELSKILISEFCYDYVKPKYGEMAKL